MKRLFKFLAVTSACLLYCFFSLSTALAEPAEVTSSTVMGSVLLHGEGLAGVTVNVNGSEVMTDSSGTYTWTGIASTSFTVLAYHPSYSFTPPGYTVTISSISPLILNFEAAPIERHALGALFDPAAFQATLRAAPSQALPLEFPAKVDLSDFLPPVGDQGERNSCVGWACGYYAQGYFQNKEHNRHPSATDSRRLLSPMFIYAQGFIGSDQGMYFNDALNILAEQGCAPLSEMPDLKDYVTKPDSRQYISALPNRIQSFYTCQPSVDAAKTLLASGKVFVIGAYIFTDFYGIGTNIYSRNNMYGIYAGNHAMTVVGYDDSKGGTGAFRIVNSWGTGWGDKGYFWCSYDTFANGNFVFGMYVLNDQPDPEAKFIGVLEDSHADFLGGGPNQIMTISNGTWSASRKTGSMAVDITGCVRGLPPDQNSGWSGKVSDAYPGTINAFYIFDSSYTMYSSGMAPLSYSNSPATIPLTGISKTYAVRGTITNNGIGLQNAAVSAGDRSSVTDADGKFVITGLPEGSCTVTPVLSNTSFEPPSRTIILGENTAPVDFSVTRSIGLSLAGTITELGKGLAGVRLTAGTATTVTDSEGRFCFYDLAPGAYLVTPAKEEYYFNPSRLQVSLTENTNAINFTGATYSYQISGTITSRDQGYGVFGATVTAGRSRAITDFSGKYTLGGLKKGACTVRPEYGDGQFTPASQDVSVGPDKTNINFIYEGSVSYAIKGKIVCGGKPLAGIMVTAGSDMLAVTDLDGMYQFSDLGSGIFKLNVQHPDYTFSPPEKTITLGPSIDNANFTAYERTYSISGSVNLLQNTKLFIGTNSVTAASSGYSYNGLRKGTYTIVPMHPYSSFSPPYRQATLGPSISNVNFTYDNIQYRISGTLKYDGSFLPGTTIKYSKVDQMSFGMIDYQPDGTFSREKLVSGSYLITPSCPGYTIYPSSLTVITGLDSENLVFTATPVTYSVAGTVRKADGTPYAGMIIDANGARATTAADGTYTIAGLLPGTYTVKRGGMMIQMIGATYTLSPSSRTVTVGPDQAGINFTVFPAAFPSYSYAGTILCDGQPQPGVTVTVGNKSIITNTDGKYSLSGIDSGNYIPQPSYPGYRFIAAVKTAVSSYIITDFTASSVILPPGGITGTITFGGEPLAGAAVIARGENSITDPAGNFTISSVGSGTYTVIPSLAGYSFTPSEVTLLNAQGAEKVDFTAKNASDARLTSQQTPGTSIEDGNTVRYSVTFPSPVTKPSVIGSQYVGIDLDGCEPDAEPGKPLLPVKGLKLVIPDGKIVDRVSIVNGRRTVLPGIFTVEPAQQPYPLSYLQTHADEILPIEPDSAVYSKDAAYPEARQKFLSVQRKKGYPIASLELHPVEYNPKKGEIAFYDGITVTLHLKDDPGSDAKLGKRGKEEDRREIAALADNGSDIAAAEQFSGPSASPAAAQASRLPTAGTYRYVVITDQLLKDTPATETIGSYPNNLQGLIQEKISRGIPSIIVTTEYIYANYGGQRPDGGVDNQTKIRNFIIDAYGTWDTEYVLLAGDGDGAQVSQETKDVIVPGRYIWCKQNEDTKENVPADLYYACLDSSFDANRNGQYGETNDGEGGNDVDLLSEVFVGRLPADSQDEIRNFVSKNLRYQLRQFTDPNYLRQACVAGEYLGKYMNFGYEYVYAEPCMEEIRLGSTANGITTKGFISEPFFTVQTMYDRGETTPEYKWTRQDMIDRINGGVHIINHDGHCDTGYALRLGNGCNWRAGYDGTERDADNLTNPDPVFIVSQGCYPLAYDNYLPAVAGNPAAFMTYDAIGEHYLCTPHGAFAFVGNSSYGWFTLPATNGHSQRYNRLFWDMIFSNRELHLGKALQLSKEKRLPGWDQVWRWQYYDLTLFGDPEMQLKVSGYDVAAGIVSPRENEGLSGQVTVTGTAGGRDFQSYELAYYPKSSPGQRQTVTSKTTTPVINGSLGIFSTTGLAPGKYVIELSVTDAGGTVSRAQVEVALNQTATVITVLKDTLPLSPVEVKAFKGYSNIQNVKTDSAGRAVFFLTEGDTIRFSVSYNGIISEKTSVVPCALAFNFNASAVTLTLDGAPVKDATVYAYRDAASAGSVKTDSAGRALMYFEDATPVSFKMTYLNFSQTSTVLMTPASCSFAMVTSTVTVAAGTTAASNAKVTAFSAAGTDLGYALTDGSGKANLCLAPGIAASAEAQYLGMALRSAPFTSPGTASLVLPSLTELTVKAFDGTPLNGVPVEAYDGSPAPLTASTNAQGKACFCIADGKQVYFTASYLGLKLQSQPVTSPGTREIAFPRPCAVSLKKYDGSPAGNTYLEAWKPGDTAPVRREYVGSSGQISMCFTDGSSLNFKATHLTMALQSPTVTTPQDVTLQFPQPATITVLKNDGAPVPAHTPVRIFEGTQEQGVSETDAQGKASFCFAGGTPVHFEPAYLGLTLQSPAITSPQDLTIQFPPATLVTVLKGDGTPVPARTPVKAFEGGREYWSTETDAQGKAYVCFLAGKQTYFQAEYLGLIQISETITTPGAATITFTRPTTLEIRQYDGSPLSYAWFYVWEGTTSKLAYVDDKGMYSHCFEPGKKIYFTAAYDHLTLQSDTVTVPSSVVLQFPQPSTILVRSFDGAPLQGLWFDMFEGGSSARSLYYHTDTAGIDRICRQPGTELTFSASYRGLTLTSDRIISPGAATITYPQLTPITIKRGSVAQQNVWAYGYDSKGTFTFSDFTNKDGMTTFCFPAGEQARFKISATNTYFTPTTTAPDPVVVDLDAYQVITITGCVQDTGARKISFCDIYLHAIPDGMLITTGFSDYPNGNFKMTAYIPDGVYRLSAVQPNYKTLYQDIAVQQGKWYAINLTLDPYYTIQGTVRCGGAAVPGATVMVNGQPSAVTDAAGAYTVKNLVTGTYRLSPLFYGSSITPNEIDVTVGPSKTKVDFTVASLSFPISGCVTRNGSPVPGIRVAGEGNETLTGADGKYLLTMTVFKSTYTVTPSHESYAFDPAERKVWIGKEGSGVDFAALKVKPSVSGTVTYQGNPCQGVTIAAGAPRAITGENGTYTLVMESSGTFTVAPWFPAGFIPKGKTFIPVSQSVTVSSYAALSGIDFAALDTTYTLRGIVTCRGQALESVTLTAGGRTTTTSADGRFTFEGLTLGNYTLIPSLDGYTFTPPEKIVPATEWNDITFDATLVTYAVSGTVKKADGTPCEGFIVNAEGNRTTTAADGTYRLSGLVPGTYGVKRGGIYITGPGGYIVSPVSYTVTLGPDSENVDFTLIPFGGYTYTGVIACDGQPLAGAAVSVGSQQAETNTGGKYTLTGMVSPSYAVEPSLPGYVFSPANRATIGNTIVTSFTAQKVYGVSGAITVGGTPAGGITVLLGSQKTITGPDGIYAFANVLPGEYLVTPESDALVFSPPNRSITVTGDVGGQDFLASYITYSIRGRITLDGSGLEGVAVSAGGKSATSASDGSYVIDALRPGSYTVKPEHVFYNFLPVETPVVLESDVSGIDFAATLAECSVSGQVTVNTGMAIVGLGGVTITAGDTAMATNSQGFFGFTMPMGETRKVTPSLAGYTFILPETEVRATERSINIAFLAFHSAPAQLAIRMAGPQQAMPRNTCQSGFPIVIEVKALDSFGNVMTAADGLTIAIKVSEGTVSPGTLTLAKGTARASIKVCSSSLRRTMVDLWAEIDGKKVSESVTLAVEAPFSADVNAVRAFPSPSYREAPVTFAPLPEHAQVMIYNIAGEMVMEARPGNASWNWTLVNGEGEKVASGIYIYLIKDAAGRSKKGTFAVLR